MHILRSYFRSVTPIRIVLKKKPNPNHQTIAKQKNATVCLRLLFCMTRTERDVAQMHTFV